MRRLIHSVIVLLGLVVAVFFFTHMLGDPARLMLRPEATAEQVDAVRERLGLNAPLHEQFFRFMGGAVRGDFGESIWQRAPAMPIMLDRLPNTLYLAGITILIAIPLAALLGIFSALRPGSLIDRASTVVGLAGVSIADFWLGLMLILFFAVNLGWFPTSGFGGPQYVILPALALMVRPLGRISQVIRSSMLDQLGQPYVTTARSKGLSERVVVTLHAMKNAAIPALTLVGDETAALLNGAVVIETVFGWPGIGLLLIQAIERRDLPLIEACVFAIAVMIIFANLLVDLAYTFFDPRIRYT
ncbi:MAG: ABC transporter permease [Thermomicrobiales bacterium]